MNLKDQIVSALGKQSADLTNVQIQEFSEEIAQRLGSQSDLSSLPEELYTREIIRLLPSIQIMVAQDSGSIQDAAQYAFQIVVQQVTDDPHSTIPEGYRSKEYCPYPGLSSFSEEDASYFFGRNKDIDAFLDTFDRRIITLTGPSGVGKSSFVSAGIFPHLRGKFGDTAVFLTFRVQTNISLLHDFSEFLSHETGEATETILQMLKQGENGLSTLLQSTLGEKYKRIFLFLDQFESLFVGDEKNREQDRVSLLDNLLFTERDQESELLTTIIASRENYFEHPAYTSRNRLVELIQRENFPLLALNDLQLRQAIEQPLNTFNQQNDSAISYQEGLVDLIVSEFHHQGVSLPLVQYILRLLWTEKYRLTHFAYNSLGGLERVLDRHAWTIYREFSDEEQSLVKAVFVALVRPGISGEYTRKRIRREALLVDKKPNHQKKIERILGRLSDASSRIISEQQIGDTAYIELTHEIILRQWVFLQGLIEERKERIETRELLLPKAERWWGKGGKDGGLGQTGELYSGNELKRARQYVENSPYQGDIEGIIAACYAASRRYYINKVRRNFLIILSLITMLSIIGSGLRNQAISAGVQQATAEARQATAEAGQATAEAKATLEVFPRETAEANATISAQVEATALADAAENEELALEQSNIALSRQLVTQSQIVQTQGDSELALLLAIEAGRVADTSEAFSQLREQITKPGRLDFTLAHPGEVFQAAWNKDGTQILSFSEDGTAIIWDVQAGRPLHTISQTISAQWDSSFSRVLATNNSNQAVIYDSQTGQIQQVFNHGYGFSGALWSNNGQFVVTLGRENNIILWDTVDGHKLQEHTFNGSIDEAIWNPSDTLLAVLSTVEQSEDGPLTAVNVIDVNNGEIRFSLVAVNETDDSVKQILWHPQGEHLLTWHLDGRVKLWQIATSQLLYVLSLDQTFQQVKWQGDDLLVTQPGNGSIIIRDAYSGEISLSIQDENIINDISWNRSATTILTTSNEGVKLIDAATGNIQMFLPHLGAEHAIWSQDEQSIISYGSWEGIKIWNVNNGQLLLTLKLDTPIHQIQWFDQVIWLEEYNIIHAISGDLLTTWDLSSGNLLMLTSYNAFIWLASMSPDNSLILTISNGIAKVRHTQATTESFYLYDDSYINKVWWQPQGDFVLINTGKFQSQVWNINEGNLQILLDQPGTVRTADWSDEGNLLLTGHPQGQVIIWDLVKGTIVSEFNHEQENSPGIEQVAWTNDETKILTVYSNGDVRLLDATSGEVLKAFSHPVGNVQAQLNQDESLIMTINSAGQVGIWNIITGQKQLVLTSESRIVSADWNADESQILTVAEGEMVQLWNALNGEMIQTINHDLGHIAPAFWSTDGNYILVQGRDILVWDVENQQIVDSPPALIGDFATELSWQTGWSPTDDLILATEANQILVWDAQTGRTRYRWDHPNVGTVLWSPNGNNILSISWSDGIRVWDVESGRIRYTLEHNEAFGISWNQSGQSFVSISNNTVKLWDLATGKERFTIPIANLQPESSIFSHVLWDIDNHHIMIWFDRSLTIFYTEITSLISLACSNTDQNMTFSEWERFMDNRFEFRTTCP